MSSYSWRVNDPAQKQRSAVFASFMANAVYCLSVSHGIVLGSNKVQIKMFLSLSSHLIHLVRRLGSCYKR